MTMTIDESMAFNKETRFTPGQKVVAPWGMSLYLAAGKVYTVEEFIEPVVMDNGFRFPAYVKVIADHGKRGTFHTHRFHAIED